MISFIKKYYLFLIILLLSLAFVKFQYNKNIGDLPSKCKTICSDARGYYAWVPYLFLYSNDHEFSFFDEVEVAEPYCGGELGGCLQDYRRETNTGVSINKYYPGSSVFMIPFFLMAHGYTILEGKYQADGYSPHYFTMMGVSGIFCFVLTMLVMLKLFNLFSLKNWQKLLGIVLFGLGTNITYYTIDKPTYSHIYSCFLILLFLYFTIRFKRNFSLKYVALLSFLVGWIAVARPVNLTILLVVPFLLVEELKAMAQKMTVSWKSILYFLPAFIFPVLLMIYYKVATGDFIVYAYNGEGFNFFSPKLANFMFSYRAGLFMYAPVLLVLLLSSIFLLKKEKYALLGLSLTVLITIYVHSSWWTMYGSTFGARTMVDFIPCFMLIYALVINKKVKYKTLFVSLLVITSLIGIFLYDCVPCKRNDLKTYLNAVFHLIL